MQLRFNKFIALKTNQARSGPVSFLAEDEEGKWVGEIMSLERCPHGEEGYRHKIGGWRRVIVEVGRIGRGVVVDDLAGDQAGVTVYGDAGDEAQEDAAQVGRGGGGKGVLQAGG